MESSDNVSETKASQQEAEDDSLLPFSGLEEASNDGTSSAIDSTAAVVFSNQDSALTDDTPPRQPQRAPTIRTNPNPHETGSFRFHSDKGVEEPEEDGHLRISPKRDSKATVQEGKLRGPELVFPDLAEEEAKQSADADDESITDSVVNLPIKEQTAESGNSNNNRVSSRLQLAQETDLVPVHHSRGSEVAFKKKEFDQMKQRLKNLVKAAELHLQSTMELQKAQQAVRSRKREHVAGLKSCVTCLLAISQHLFVLVHHPPNHSSLLVWPTWPMTLPSRV